MLVLWGNIWLRSIQHWDGAERGEGLGLSTGNADHPSTPLLPNITYFFRGNSGKKKNIREQDKGWIHLRILLKRSMWGTFVKWKYSEILIASMDNGLPSLRMLLLSTLRGGDMYPKAVVLLVKNNSIFRWPRLLCQYYPSSSQCFLLFVLYLYFSNGSEWERVKDHFAGSSLWSGWTGWILRFISPFPPFSMVGAHLPHFPGTQIYIWTKHW